MHLTIIGDNSSIGADLRVEIRIEITPEEISRLHLVVSQPVKLRSLELS